MVRDEDDSPVLHQRSLETGVEEMVGLIDETEETASELIRLQMNRSREKENPSRNVQCD